MSEERASASEKARGAEPATASDSTPEMENVNDEIEVEVVIEEECEPSEEDVRPKIPKKINNAKEEVKGEIVVDVPKSVKRPKEPLPESKEAQMKKDSKRRDFEEALTNKMKKEIVSPLRSLPLSRLRLRLRLFSPCCRSLYLSRPPYLSWYLSRSWSRCL